MPRLRWRRALAGAAVAVCLASCASGPETRRLQQETVAIELGDVPFFPQQDYQCGPAALATVLGASGKRVDPSQLIDEVFVPARQGSLQAELVAAVRRHGRVPYVLDPRMDAALEELRDGRPVLLLQNLGSSARPVWHYAVLVGFDPRTQSFMLRSGRDARVVMPAARLLRSWDRGGRWMLVVTRADELPASAGVEGWLRASAPLESVGALSLAAQAYQAAVRRWPDAALAWAALGNLQAQQGETGGALQAYRRALALDDDAALVRNNYAWVLAKVGCRDQAIAELEAALRQADAGAHTVLQQTLQEVKDSPTASGSSCAL